MNFTIMLILSLAGLWALQPSSDKDSQKQTLAYAFGLTLKPVNSMPNVDLICYDIAGNVMAGTGRSDVPLDTLRAVDFVGSSNVITTKDGSTIAPMNVGVNIGNTTVEIPAGLPSYGVILYAVGGSADQVVFA